MAEDAERCKGCGENVHESMAAGMDNEYVTQLLVCHACADRERTARANRGAEGGLPDGARFVTKRRSSTGQVASP